MRNIIKNKKGQMENPVITFAVIAIALIIFAPIALKIFTSIHTSVGDQLGNLSGQQGVIAKANFQAVTTPLVSWWDKVVVAAFILTLLLLFVSAFLIDANPVFIILYVLSAMFMIIFTPNMLNAVDNIYNSSSYALEVTQLPFMDFLRSNFIYILVGVIVITGIIIYGKIAFFNAGRSNRR